MKYADLTVWVKKIANEGVVDGSIMSKLATLKQIDKLVADGVVIPHYYSGRAGLHCIEYIVKGE